MKRNGYTDILKVPGITYTRTGKATAWRLDGTLQTFEPNVPRITDAGITIEGQRTNLFPNSNGSVFANAPNSVPNGDLSPRGIMEATSIVDITSAPNRYELIIAPNTYSTGAAIYASWFQKRKNFTGRGYSSATESLISPTGNVNAIFGIPYKLGNYAHGWERWGVLFNISDGSLESRLRLYFGGNNFVDQPIGISNPFAFWGIQFEQAALPSTPIITSGAAATRGVDNLRLAKAIAAGEDFTVVVDGVHGPADGNAMAILTLSDGTTINQTYLRRSTTGSLSANTTVNGVATTTPGRAFPVGGPAKCAIRRQGKELTLAVNGAIVGTDTSATAAPAFTSVRIGALMPNSSQPAYVNARRTLLLPYALTDAELINLTK